MASMGAQTELVATETIADAKVCFDRALENSPAYCPVCGSLVPMSRCGCAEGLTLRNMIDCCSNFLGGGGDAQAAAVTLRCTSLGANVIVVDPGAPTVQDEYEEVDIDPDEVPGDEQEDETKSPTAEPGPEARARPIPTTALGTDILTLEKLVSIQPDVERGNCVSHAAWVDVSSARCVGHTDHTWIGSQ